MTADQARRWQLGSEFTAGGKDFKVESICSEPDTGLVRVEQVDHPLKPVFTVPFEFVDSLYGHCPDCLAMASLGCDQSERRLLEAVAHRKRQRDR